MSLTQLTLFTAPLLLAALILLFLHGKICGAAAARIAILSLIFSVLGFMIPAHPLAGHPLLHASDSSLLTKAFIGMILVIGLVALLTGLNDEKYQIRCANYYAFLLFFIFSMILTVSFSDFRFFFISWEHVLLVSSLLIAYWGKGENRRRIARYYFIISQAASFCILIALVIIGTQTGSWSLHNASLEQLTINGRNWVVALFCIGFFTKLAVFPLHFWLPDAHTTASMPVTILLASAMLPLGAYGIFRFIFDIGGFTLTADFQWLFLSMGILTKIIGAILATQKNNVKRIIAYSSISQAGFFLIAFGINTPASLAIGLLHILAHGPIKALLFICAGEIYQISHKNSIKKINLPIHENRILFMLYLFASTALIGIPPLSGFFSEFYLGWAGIMSSNYAITVIALAASVLTAIYLLRVAHFVFFQNNSPLNQEKEKKPFKLSAAILFSLLVILVQSALTVPMYQWLLKNWKGV
ncbi:MAG: complex I subunit 5 family protein [Anaerolineaceae bacterium]|nr:complex I subunit 5 family protein [Anaerolineaceae bacterium]